MASPTLEYQPLLPVGFHRMAVADLRALCVQRFPLSATRAGIMTGLEHVLQELHGKGIVGEVWIDGSFLTEKIDLVDVDGSICIPFAFWQSATLEQRDTINRISPANLKAAYHCDLYAWIEYPQGHADYARGQWLRAYWHRQWGFSRSEEMKGIAVVVLPLGGS